MSDYIVGAAYRALDGTDYLYNGEAWVDSKGQVQDNPGGLGRYGLVPLGPVDETTHSYEEGYRNGQLNRETDIDYYHAEVLEHDISCGCAIELLENYLENGQPE